jgi:biopolymer transport protein ExbD
MNSGARRKRKIVRELRKASREGELNVVSLIDIFAILVFYLLVNALVVEILPSPKALKLPESIAKEEPKQTVLILVTNEDIIVDNQKVMSTADAAAATASVLPDLKYKLNEQTLMQVEGRQHHGRQGDPLSRAEEGHGDLQRHALRQDLAGRDREGRGGTAMSTRRHGVRDTSPCPPDALRGVNA